VRREPARVRGAARGLPGPRKAGPLRALRPRRRPRAPDRLHRRRERQALRLPALDARPGRATASADLARLAHYCGALELPPDPWMHPARPRNFRLTRGCIRPGPGTSTRPQGTSRRAPELPPGPWMRPAGPRNFHQAARNFQAGPGTSTRPQGTSRRAPELPPGPWMRPARPRNFHQAARNFQAGPGTSAWPVDASGPAPELPPADGNRQVRQGRRLPCPSCASESEDLPVRE
jgi:hypothetical protein